MTGVLGAAVDISILLHAVLLSMHFNFPDSLRWKSANQPLEVVLVNAKTRERPVARRSAGAGQPRRRRQRRPAPSREDAAAGDRAPHAGEGPCRCPAPGARARGAAAAPARAGARIAPRACRPRRRVRALRAARHAAERPRSRRPRARRDAPAGADRPADPGVPEAPAQEVHRRQRRRIPLRAVRGGLAHQGGAPGHAQLSGRRRAASSTATCGSR